MVTQRIVIRFEANGARTVQANIKAVGGAARKASKETDFLKRSLKALIALETARRIILLADSFTLLQNRIRVLTDSQAGLVKTTQSLFEVANRTRTSIESNALLFQRLTLATQGLVRGEGEVLQIVETLNKALRISGTTTQEASAGTIQLAQGFAFGALRGDELRSVMEQLPVVSRILEKELGITRGELRELGKQGKITSEILVSAFRNARQEIEEKFQKVVPTVGEQFVVLRNEFIRLLGAINNLTGAFTLLSNGVRFVADNIGTLAKILAVLAIPVLIAAYPAIVALIAGSTALTAVLATLKVAAIAFFTALGAWPALLAVLIGLVVAFSDDLFDLWDSLFEGNRALKTVEREVAETNRQLLAFQKQQELAALAAEEFAAKVSVVESELSEQVETLKLSIAAQEELAAREKFFNELREKGIDIQAKGTAAQKAALEAKRVEISQLTEEAALLKELEGPALRAEKRRAAARRLFAKEKGDREILLKIAREEIDITKDLEKALKTEISLLKEETAFSQQYSDFLKIENELRRRKIDLSSEEGQKAFERLKALSEERRENEIRRQNLRDFNIDQSLQNEFLKVLSKQLKENAKDAKFKEAVLKELNLEEAKLLQNLGGLTDTDVAKVFEDSLRPAREVLALLKAEGAAIRKTNIERDISIERVALENRLKRRQIDVTDDLVQNLLNEIDAQKRLNEVKLRQRDFEEEFGITRQRAIEREAGLNMLLAQGNLNFDQRRAILADLNAITSESTDFFKGLAQGFLDIDTSVLKLGQDISGFLVNTINGAADALADFAISGFQDTKKLKEAFSDLFRQLAKDLIAATIRLIIFKTIQAGISAFAAPTGDLTQGVSTFSQDQLTSNISGPFALRQAGGFLNAGQPSIVGEKGPEPFVPTVSGRVLPNSALDPKPPQVTIVNVTDPKEIQSFLSTTEGEDVIMNVIQKRNRQVRGLLR